MAEEVYITQTFRHIDVLNEEEREVRKSIEYAKQELEDIKKQISDYKASKALPATEKNCKEFIRNFIKARTQPPSISYTEPIWTTAAVVINE